MSYSEASCGFLLYSVTVGAFYVEFVVEKMTMGKGFLSKVQVLLDLCNSSVTVGGGVQLGPLGNAATNGLLCHQLQVFMMEELVE
jgi:hypothetical protein